jgi:hypothetical protein
MPSVETHAKRCGAKNKPGAKNRFCISTKLGPSGRCRMHNGFAVSGPAHPNFKHGRHSILLKSIPALGEHYERALSDPDLLSLTDEIAMTDARIGQLLEKVKGPKASVDGVWPQLELLMENRRKLVDTESKRMKDLHAMVSVDRVLLIIRYLQDAVRKHVKDPQEQTAIFTEMRRLLKPEQALTT